MEAGPTQQWRQDPPPGGWDRPVPNTLPAAGDAYAVKTELGRAWGFTALSFGIWGLVWFHRNRRLVDGELGQGRDDALPHTVGLFVPILNFFVIHWLWRDFNVLRQRVGLQPFPGVAYLVGSIFLAPVFYSLVLAQINEFWDARTQGLASQGPASTGEKVAIGIGIAFWLLLILLIVLIIVLVAIAGTFNN